MVDNQKIIDNMIKARQYWDSKKEQAKLRPSEREQILGLKFKKGQEVKDNVSGEKAIILGGTREIVGIQGTGGKGH